MTMIVHFNSLDNQPDSEQAYHAWLAGHSAGFVLNLLKTSDGKCNKSAMRFTRLHHASCKSINNRREYSQPMPFTGGRYFKICAEDLPALEVEALKMTGLKEVKCCRCFK